MTAAAVIFAVLAVGYLVWTFLREAWRCHRNARAEPEIEWELEPHIKIEMAQAILYDRGYRLGEENGVNDWETLAVRISECLANMPKEQAAEIIAEWDSVCSNIAKYRKERSRGLQS